MQELCFSSVGYVGWCLTSSIYGIYEEVCVEKYNTADIIGGAYGFM